MKVKVDISAEYKEPYRCHPYTWFHMQLSAAPTVVLFGLSFP